jgi:hypothetical protein
MLGLRGIMMRAGLKSLQATLADATFVQGVGDRPWMALVLPFFVPSHLHGDGVPRCAAPDEGMRTGGRQGSTRGRTVTCLVGVKAWRRPPGGGTRGGRGRPPFTVASARLQQKRVPGS